MLQEGDAAPDFSANDADGLPLRLSELRGNKVALYFYPKDDTPGCTKEACSFRDSFSKLERRGITVVGISPDKQASHFKFRNKYDLPFTLLSDLDHKIADYYGAYGEKKFMGRTYQGVKRMTFLIDTRGKIKKIFNKVKPEGHADEVLLAFDD